MLEKNFLDQSSINLTDRNNICTKQTLEESLSILRQKREVGHQNFPPEKAPAEEARRQKLIKEKREVIES